MTAMLHIDGLWKAFAGFVATRDVSFELLAGETIASVRDIVKARGLTLLFTEHDMSVVFGIAERISVLHHGEIIASGAPDAVRNDPEVKRVYLGEHAHG